MSQSESNQTTTNIVLVVQHNLLNNISSSRKCWSTQITQQNMYRSLYIKHVSPRLTTIEVTVKDVHGNHITGKATVHSYQKHAFV
jgi:hypothetical protein